jgi:hypothetical protein
MDNRDNRKEDNQQRSKRQCLFKRFAYLMFFHDAIKGG